jgi:hypothetical protein
MTRKHEAPLDYARAIEAMRRPGTRLVQMHGGRDAGFYIVPPGRRVEEPVAAKIMNHPLVRAGHDALFPGMSQTWTMLSDGPREGAA